IDPGGVPGIHPSGDLQNQLLLGSGQQRSQRNFSKTISMEPTGRRGLSPRPVFMGSGDRGRRSQRADQLFYLGRDGIIMKTTGVRIYGKEDLRLETWELPDPTEDEIL